MFVCNLFVFLSLMEYAFAQVIIQFKFAIGSIKYLCIVTYTDMNHTVWKKVWIQKVLWRLLEWIPFLLALSKPSNQNKKTDT